MTQISLISEAKNNVVISSGMFFSANSVSIGGVNTNKQLHVNGNVGNNVTFRSHNADFLVDGSVGNQCNFKTHNGEITTGNVGQNTTLMTHNGDVSCEQVGIHSSLKTHNGDVHAAVMSEHTSATSHNGDVRADRAAKSAELETYNGNVYENGIKRKKEKAQSSSISIGNMSFIGGGRIIVNGQDITSLVNSASRSAPKEDEEPPVRYNKFM